MRRRLVVDNFDSIFAVPAQYTALRSWASRFRIDTFMYLSVDGACEDFDSVIFPCTGPCINCGPISVANANAVGNMIASLRTSGVPYHVPVRLKNTAVIGGSSPYGDLRINQYHNSQLYALNKSFHKTGSGLCKVVNYFGFASTPAQLAAKFISDYIPMAATHVQWRTTMKALYQQTPSLETTLGKLPAGYENMVCDEVTKTSTTVHIDWGIQNMGTYSPVEPTSNNEPIASFGRRMFLSHMSRLDLLGQAWYRGYGNTNGKLNISVGINPGVMLESWMLANPAVTWDDIYNAYLTAFSATPFPGKSWINIDGYVITFYDWAHNVRP